MLLSTDFYEHFVDVKGTAKTLVFTLRQPSVFGAKFDAPATHGFISNNDATLSQNTFSIAMAEIESVIQLRSVTYDLGRKAMSLVSLGD